MISKNEKNGLRRIPKAFSGRNHKFKRFFRPKSDDLQKKKKEKTKKTKDFAEIRRLFLAAITNSNVFSGQKKQLFPPQKIPWGTRYKSGGGGSKNENRGGQRPPAPPLATRLQRTRGSMNKFNSTSLNHNVSLIITYNIIKHCR